MKGINVWEVCEFSDDIKFGRLDPSRFAVELHSVLDGSADPIYTDPKLFILNTYPTENMKFMLKEALRRLSSRGGQPVFILDTEFGGGKTHTLLLLYHIFRDRKVGTEFIRELGIDREIDVLEVPEAKVVAIDCRKVEKKTLWGELAYRLGRYEDFKSEDLEMRPIHDIGRIKALFNTPTLVLMDELPDYLLKADSVEVGGTTLLYLTLSFILNLISAVASTRDSMLIISLTGKQSLYERYVRILKDQVKTRILEDQKDQIKTLRQEVKIEELHNKMLDVFSRQAQYIVPIEKGEVSKIIRRRLVKTIKDESLVKELAKDFRTYYREKGISMDPALEEGLESSYPFHPFLIDVLYDRLSTIESFNKTRGMLRLLAMILHRIYRDRAECRIVSTGDIPLHDPDIKDELTSRLGKGEMRPVIETDCIDKAKAMDEKRRVKIAEKVAKTIYIYSLIGAAKISGIRPGEIKLAVCQPGVDPALIDDVLKEMEDRFWYLKSEGGAYYFDKEPNINKIVYDYMSEVRPEDVRERIRKTLESLLRSTGEVKCIVWDSAEVEDGRDEIKIFAVDYKNLKEGDEESVLESILQKTHEGGMRKYRNTLVMVLPDVKGIDAVHESATLRVAIEMAKGDERIKLDRDRLKKIDEKLSTAEGNLKLDCRNVYSRIAYPRIGDGKLYIDDIGTEEGQNITDMVLNSLRRRGKLVDELEPGAILDIFRSDDGAKREKITVEEIYDLYRLDRRKPFILKGSVVLEAVKKGVVKGLFGYAEELVVKDGKYLARIGQDVEVKWNGWVISPDAVYVEKEAIGPEVERERKEGPPSPPKYTYSIECGNLDEVIENIRKIIVITVGGGLDVRLSLNLSNHYEDNIAVDSRFRNPSELESLLSTLKSKGYRGGGSFQVSSQKDLRGEFEKYGIRVRSL